MDSSGALNLIDLDSNEEQNIQEVENKSLIEEFQPFAKMFPIIEGRNSIDDNPFDKVLKQVNFLDEAFNDQQKYVNCQNNVKTDNLLIMEECKFECNTGDTLSKQQHAEKTNCYLSLPKLCRFGSNNSNTLSSISSLDSVHSPKLFDDNLSPIVNNAKHILNTNEVNNILVENKVNESNLIDYFENAFINNSDDSVFSSLYSKSNENQLGKNLTNAFKKSSINNELSPDSEITHLTKNEKNQTDQNSNTLRNQLLRMNFSNSSLNSPLLHANKNNGNILEQSVFAEARCLADCMSKMAVTGSPKISEDSYDDLMKTDPKWINSETDIDSDLEQLRIPMLQEIDKCMKECSPVKFDEKILLLLERHKENRISISEQIENKYLNMTKNVEKSNEARVETPTKIEMPFDGSSTTQNQKVDDLINDLKKKILECDSESQKAEANILLESLSALLQKNNSNNMETTTKSNQLPVPVPPIIRQGTFDLDISLRKSNGVSQPKIPIENDEKSTIHVENEEKSEPTSTSDLSPNVLNIIQKVSKLLEKEAGEVVATNITGENGTISKPTYIVVMGMPNASTQIHEIHDFNSENMSPELSAHPRTRRSNSVSLPPQKAPRYSFNLERTSKNDPILTPKANVNVYRTPVRSTLQRRNSISSPVNVRRSIYSEKLSLNTSSAAVNKPTVPVYLKKNVPDNISNMKVDITGRNLKLKTGERKVKPHGPLRATVPVKKVTTIPVTPSIVFPIDAAQNRKLVTSTPIESASYKRTCPSASSTPIVSINHSNLTTPTSTKPRSRLSYSSATPNPKSSTSVTHLNRRRTLTQLKSPIKFQQDSLKVKGVTVINSSSQQNTSKNTFCSLKPPRRSSLTYRNKENKNPK